MEIGLRFTGLALNAVDAKGRVSLPAGFRTTIERRLQRITVPAGADPLPKAIKIGEHERYPALQAFDIGHEDVLHSRLEDRARAAGGDDFLAAFDDEQLDAFSAYEEVSFDPAGRMVLPAGLRRRANISDLAFFVSAGETFQVWDPDRFLEAHPDKTRACERLKDLLEERGTRGRGGAA